MSCMPALTGEAAEKFQASCQPRSRRSFITASVRSIKCGRLDDIFELFCCAGASDGDPVACRCVAVPDFAANLLLLLS